MRSSRGVLLLATAVLPSASAQSVCQTGWTQAPSSSDWGSKCYRAFGPTAPIHSVPLSTGYNHSGCKAACKNDSTTGTGRMLCLASEAEMTFVAKQAYMKGRVAFTQDSSRLDYAEPAGGWGWECGSTYVPSWSIDGDNGVQPSNTGEGDGFVACAKMTHAGTMQDRSCSEGDDTTYWSNRALLGPLSRCRTHALTTHPLLRRGLHLRGRPDDTNLLRLRGPELRGQGRPTQRARPVPR